MVTSARIALSTWKVFGAKFYYLRNILHDYADEKCILILKSLIPALDKELKILIDDMVLPNMGVHWHATSVDITMVAALGSQERTADEFRSLVEKAELRILETYTYTWPVMNAVMVLVPAEEVRDENVTKEQGPLRKEEEVKDIDAGQLKVAIRTS
ncbi:uncharacterized protein PAC_02546 [Phialocephala subalpina]|uniref:O-methyltransferase C-terminal domain-containing protein n=1 Tax=Phialocephala subalpina TaxID=576137 RepID=A0A1L7WIR8_9HELO|nr:uncharacterized protein PAC_02546 [Phialocephala subalpina]